MKIKTRPSTNEGLIVEYDDEVSDKYVSRFGITVSREAINIRYAIMVKESDIRAFNRLMTLAVQQHRHLKCSQTFLEQS